MKEETKSLRSALRGRAPRPGQRPQTSKCDLFSGLSFLVDFCALAGAERLSVLEPLLENPEAHGHITRMRYPRCMLQFRANWLSESVARLACRRGLAGWSLDGREVARMFAGVVKPWGPFR